MKLCIFNMNRIGIVLDANVADVTAVFDDVLSGRWPFPRHDLVIAHFEVLRPRIEAALAQAPRLPLAQVRLASPVANPGKIIGAPINYRDHIAEANADAQINHGKNFTSLDKFGLFNKVNSALIGCSEEVLIPLADRRTDHEVELAVIIGKKARAVSRENAMAHVFGYSIGLDMTVRGPEFPGFRKSADTFAVLGPWITTADEIADPNALDMSIRVNGELRQEANTRDLIFNVQRLIEYASAMYTLHPGDVIMTGTPAGVGPVQPGDVMLAQIEGIGTMTVNIARSEPS